MNMLNKALETIKLYYPYNLSFDDPDYKKTSQYKNLLKINLKMKNNIDFQTNIKDSISHIFKGYSLLDWTNLSLHNCLEFRILLHYEQSIIDDDVELVTVLGNKRRDLFVYVSNLTSFYYKFIHESYYDPKNNDWSFKKIPIDKNSKDFNENFYNLINKLNHKMATLGYEELTKEVAETIVDNIDTECIEKGACFKMTLQNNIKNLFLNV